MTAKRRSRARRAKAGSKPRGGRERADASSGRPARRPARGAAKSTPGRSAPKPAAADAPRAPRPKAPAGSIAKSPAPRAKSAAKSGARRGAADPAVERYFARLDHPEKSTMLAVRDIVFGLDPRIREEIKWNAPSFRLDDHFATFHLRGNSALLVLHRGARGIAPRARPAIPDPSRLLEWRGTDRAIVTLAGESWLAAHRDDLRAVVAAWIALLAQGPEPR